jgi:OmpA-OmpF porin, OOP family
MFHLPSRHPFIARAATALTLTLAAGLAAGAGEPVLKSADVTESALIEALALEPSPAPDGTQRGFKPALPGTAGSTAQKSGPGRANLLITFDTGKATLTAESRAALDTLARALQSDALAGLSFRVEGHADPRGQAEANLRLSQARAETVVGYLMSTHGILPERLAPRGKGSAELLNKKVVDAPENRRVTIVSLRG